MEIPKLALSPESIGFWGTILFTFVEAWGLWIQNARIWREKSGSALSVTWLIYTALVFSVMLVYGSAKPDTALTFNGLLIFLQLAIVFGVVKFKRLTRFEKVLSFGVGLYLVATIAFPFKDWFFLVCSIGSIASFGSQPYEMWKVKSCGVVEIRLLIVYFTSTVFWIVYGFAVHDWVLEIICPAFMAVLLVTFVMYYRYRQPETTRRR